VYDNNHRQDFHAIVLKGIPEELYWVEEEQQIFRKLQKERRLREEAVRAKVSLEKYFIQDFEIETLHYVI
jgi:starch synthase